MKQWLVTVKARVPTSAQVWNGSSYEKDYTDQITTLTVPDAGGYFATKALLEASYGSGRVLSLIEK